jgi:hypothetical protein
VPDTAQVNHSDKAGASGHDGSAGIFTIVSPQLRAAEQSSDGTPRDRLILSHA